MRHLLIILTLLISYNVFSQNDKTVNLVVSGQGKTIEEAKQNALRSAIEQAFGTFISSKTEVLNDDLVKDEIVSISNGNIQKTSTLSEIQLPNGNYSVTLSTVVSVNKLTSFCVGKGISVEFNGSLFAYNISQQELNESNELKAIKNMKMIVNDLADMSFSYKIMVDEPYSLEGNNNHWNVPITVDIMTNNNFNQLLQLMFNTLSGISLTKQDIDGYNKLGKKIYPITIAINNKTHGQFFLRNKVSIDSIRNCVRSLKNNIMNFVINNGISNVNVPDLSLNYERSNILTILFDSTDFMAISDLQRATGISLFDNWYNHYVSNEKFDCTIVDNFTPTGSKYFYTKKYTIGNRYNHLGLLLSFITNDSNLIKFKFCDVKTLTELKKISEYKISPLN